MSAAAAPATEAAARQALADLHEQVAAEGEPLAGPLAPGPPAPGMGPLAAAGPRTRGRARDYAFVAEAVFEGYLLHYGRPRILVGADPDLALLAGDHLYALGINHLATLEDPESVRLLSDLIRMVADLQARDGAELAKALWVAQITALSCGIRPGYEAAVAALMEAEEGSAEALSRWAEGVAEDCSADREILVAANAIDLPPFHR